MKRTDSEHTLLSIWELKPGGFNQSLLLTLKYHQATKTMSADHVTHPNPGKQQQQQQQQLLTVPPST